MINSFFCTGRTTTPIELKSTPTGKSVCDFSLACEEGYGDKKKVEFLDFKAWNKTAELLSKVEKGTVLAIQARATSNTYKSKDKTYKNKYFEVKEVHIMSKRGDFSNSYQQPAPTYAGADSSDFEEIVEDDDLPF